MADEAQLEIEQLRSEIRAHDRRYYVDAAPTISDLQYDRLMQRLKELEAAHPELATADSPTQRVGGEPVEGFRTVTHARPMYSIENTYNTEGLRDWARRCFEAFDPRVQELKSRIVAIREANRQFKGAKGPEASAIRKARKEEEKSLVKSLGEVVSEGERSGYPILGGYFAEPKIDGVAISLRYEDTLLSLAATRGDGMRGDDVTRNVRTIQDVPNSLRNGDQRIPKIIEIRGEVFLPHAEFERLNAAAKDAGEEPFANPRNAAAGTLKQLDSRKVANRKLRFIAHGRGEVDGDAFIGHQEFLEAIQRWHVPINTYAQLCPSLLQVSQFIERFDEDRSRLDYGVDGVVVRVNRFSLQDELGFTSRFPRWCIAYKYPSEQAVTQLTQVDWQVGKTGKLTPRATMSPVFIAGTTVRHATLHNMGEIRRKDIRIGDTVVIEKAGEIIPQVVKVLPEKRSENSKPIVPPNRCPACGANVEVDFDKSGKETARFCINPECPAQFRERVIHFVGRNQMRIEGLGEEVIDQLIRKGGLNHLADLYALSRETLSGLTHTAVIRGKETLVRLGERNATQILKSLEKSKRRGLARVLASLGIRHIGIQTARVIASNVSHIDDLLEGSKDRIRSVVSESGENSRLRKAIDVAAAFYDALHSLEGEARVTSAKDKAVHSGETDLKHFLDELPEGGPKWRIKWGSGGGKKDRILSAYTSLDQLLRATKQDFIDLFDDEVIGHSFYDFLTSAAGRDTIERLKRSGVSFASHEPIGRSGTSPLSGKTFVVTGTLKRYSRDEIQSLIDSLGGHAASSVSSNTDYLIAGEKAGSKLAKAHSLGVKVLDEEGFAQLIEGQGHRPDQTLF